MMYVDKDINQAIGKMQPVELQDDLKQEIFLVIAEMAEERLMDMYQKGFLKFFLVRTMLNMMKSDRSTFFKMFRKPSVEYADHHDKPDHIEEDISQHLHSNMEKLHWYEKEVFQLYANNGKNIVRLSKDTQIPYRSLFKTINKVKRTMKSAMRKEHTQKKLLGNYVLASIDVMIDINKDTNTDDMMDIMDEISDFIKAKCQGRQKDETSIKEVGDLKIKRII